MNAADLFPMLSHYGLNLVVAFVLIMLVYNRNRNNEPGYVFIYFMFNTIVFFISFLLSAIDISVGFAFGLFAIFGIMRYRTEPIPIREMTYLFATITLGLINGLSIKNFQLCHVLVPNLAILTSASVLEFFLSRQAIQVTKVIYEKIENIKPENYDMLLEDLETRIGLEIRDVKITKIDFMRDIARIKIYHKDPAGIRR